MKQIFLLLGLLTGVFSHAAVVNGNFNTLSPLGFTTDYTQNCVSTTSPGQYCVKAVGWSGATSHTPGGYLMLVDGRPNSSAGNKVWAQTVSVNANTAYLFSYWIDLRNQTGQEAHLQAVIDGVVVGTYYTDDVASGWLNVVTNFTSGAGTTVDIEIRQLNYGDYSDFNLDDISITELEEGECDITSNFTYTPGDDPCSWDLAANSLAGTSNTTIVGYLWDFGNGVGSTDPNPSVTFTSSGTFNVCLTTYAVDNEGNCCSSTKCVEFSPSCYDEPCEIEGTFDVVNEPGPGECYYVFQASITSSGTIIGYVWDFGDGTTGNGQQASHTYTSGGIYIVCLTAIAIGSEGECCTIHICQEIEVDCEGKGGGEKKTGSTTDQSSAEEMDHQLQLFPNPANNVLNLQFNSTKKAGKANIYVLDNTGRILSELTEQVSVHEGSNQITINTSDLPSGIYMINMESDGKMTSQKFVKE